jgi:hypothetical protein
MNAIELMAANTALKHMVNQGYLCICTIDNILKLTGGVPDKRDYETLRLLHCVHFNEMPDELRRGLPVLIQRVVNAPGLEFVTTPGKGMYGVLLRLST